MIDQPREKSDGHDLKRLVETLRIARRTRSVIWQNFPGMMGIGALGIALAAFGFLSSLLAALIHVSSELIIISNSARLMPTDDTMGLREFACTPRPMRAKRLGKGDNA